LLGFISPKSGFTWLSSYQR